MHCKYTSVHVKGDDDMSDSPEGLKGAALNGSTVDKSVLDITRSSRLFTPEIPQKLCKHVFTI